MSARPSENLNRGSPDSFRPLTYGQLGLGDVRPGGSWRSPYHSHNPIADQSPRVFLKPFHWLRGKDAGEKLKVEYNLGIQRPRPILPLVVKAEIKSPALQENSGDAWARMLFG
jgi:hypothetical protein